MRMRFFTAFCSMVLLASARADETAHWSFRPRAAGAVPVFADAAARTWIRSAIDAFVLKELRARGLTPTTEADRATLIRRLTFDLTGLPPTPEDADAFVRDDSPDAYERLVDRLLANPRHGERAARHWLDVVRFAETEGFEYDREWPGAWRYRDWVIRAFNDDKPFDRFTFEQLAGDELPGDDLEKLVATGFHRLGPVRRNAGNQLVASSRNEVLTEMADAVGATFLGLTVGCARCHDHKFDDITQKDYYRLQAFVGAAQEHNEVLVAPDVQADWTRRTEPLAKRIKELQKKLDTADVAGVAALNAEISDLQSKLPDPLPTIGGVRNRMDEQSVVHVLKRGDPENKGVRVGPRVPGALATSTNIELAADTSDPRTRLARWLTRPDHPLTARVWANRIWQQHFGRGIVATANDFGANGSLPSHPELLDWLADRLVDNGWRTKGLRRLILLSATYRQSAAPVDPTATARLDPDNRLLGRFPRRRLGAEEIRDSLLAVAGRLNPKTGGPSIMVPVDADLVDQLYDPLQWRVTPGASEHDRRSIYLQVKRNLQLPFFAVFDQPDSQVSCARRDCGTHALQALELLNGELSNRLAADLADRLRRECGSDPARIVDRAFRLATGRAPAPREAAASLAFLRAGSGDDSLKEFALALFNLNAFIYVD